MTTERMVTHHCPKHPTDGWCHSTLESHGIQSRGSIMTYAQMLAKLRSLGYEVSAAKTAPKPTETR